MATCIGIEIGISLLIAVITFLCISLGVLSISVLYGYLRKSFVKGFKVFTIMSSILLSILATSILLFIINKITHWGYALEHLMLMGILSGIVAGSIIGFVINFIIITTTKYIQQKFNLS
jgi:ABC-type Fe3+-siderophore transport system permease subunit